MKRGRFIKQVCVLFACIFQLIFEELLISKMEVLHWGTSDDGLYDFVSMSERTLGMGMHVMRNAFFMDETVSRACGLFDKPEAVGELEELCLRAARDGISIIAVEKSTGKIAGAAFNIFQIEENIDKDTEFYETFYEKCQYPGSKQLVKFMIDIANDFDVFSHYNVKCFVEIMFLAVLSEHRGHGLAKKLFECSIKLCQKLSRGEPVQTSVGPEIPRQDYPKPQLVAAYCSSFITQKITKSLGFENVHNIDFNTWEFQGKTFAELIGPSTKCTSVDCLLL